MAFLCIGEAGIAFARSRWSIPGRCRSEKRFARFAPKQVRQLRSGILPFESSDCRPAYMEYIYYTLHSEKHTRQ